MKPMISSIVLAALFSCAISRGEDSMPAHVAIFDFQMKEGSEAWTWLEKGLPDMATSDFIDRGVPVVARDNMERVARAVHWAPEFARESPDKIEEIRKQLQIDYVVTGTYSVRSNRVTLSAQVVNILSRQEVLRKEITGSADDIFQLQREMSASLLAWFSHREEASILPTLKPWAKNIPAARALYEGMHFYDEGRYGEAWVKFRQAARQDPNYSDAAYWSARMFYFMDRYDHARLAYGDFVNKFPDHPRAGDAIKEYINTYEKLDRPADELLSLFQNAASNFPRVRVFNEMGMKSGVPMKEWMEVRTGQLLGQLGRYAEGSQIAWQGREQLNQWEGLIAKGNDEAQFQLTGESVMPGRFFAISDQTIFFKETDTDITVKKDYDGYYYWWSFIAPTGCAFRSLHIFPICDPGTMSIGMHMHKDDYGDVPTPRKDTKLNVAMAEGYNFTNLPRSAHFRFHIWRNDNPLDKSVKYHGLRIKAQFERVGPQGAMDVHCDSTHNFRVAVDGRMGRAGDGLVGLIPPGEHTLQFSIGRKAPFPGYTNLGPFGVWATNVVVRTGEVVQVTGHLPWQDGSPWTSWTTGRLIGRDYPGFYLHLNNEASTPFIQADDDAIRVIWTYMGDLWKSVSTNGDTFSRPEKFAMPISSGWVEHGPQIIRDQSGRFILTFLSDRNAQREERLYASWSRDFQNWSAPAMIEDKIIWHYDFIQDDSGRYLLANASEKGVRVLASRDGSGWEEIAKLELPGLARGAKIVQRGDGGFDLGVVFEGPRPERERLHNGSTCDHLGLFRSDDGIKWSELKPVTLLGSDRELNYAMLCSKKRTYFACFEEKNRPVPEQMLMIGEQADGTWKTSTRIPALGSRYATMKWHPKWGYMISWSGYMHMTFPLSSSGPYLIRGPDLKGVFGKEFEE